MIVQIVRGELFALERRSLSEPVREQDWRKSAPLPGDFAYWPPGSQ